MCLECGANIGYFNDFLFRYLFFSYLSNLILSIMKNLCWGITLFLLVFIPVFSFAQNTLSGTVLDDEGQPLYGATVIVKGTNEGTVTDSPRRI